MRTLGVIILIIGIILGIYALSMDTSVQVNYDGNSFGLPERVNNIGLMNTKQNLVIVAGVLAIIGTLILILKKSNNAEDQSLDIEKKNGNSGTYNKSQIENNESLKKTHTEEQIKVDPFETLRKLKESGLISDSEYEEKYKGLVNLIELKEKTDELDFYNKILNKRTTKKAQPLIYLAIKAKEGGLISEQEYDEKKKEIFDKCLDEVRTQDLGVTKDSYHKLSQPKKDRVEDYLETISPTDLIVLHHNKIKVIEEIRWKEIMTEGIAGNFEIIYQNHNNSKS
jgi:hypothetical protein